MASRTARVLLAEDETHLAQGIGYNLEKRGFEVVIHPRGDDALEAASSQPFDLIVLDVMLPGLTGFEICERLRKRGILTPILMLTARSELENRIKGLKLGADDYLGKPFHLEEFLARAEGLLRRRHWDDVTPPQSEVASIGPVEFDSNRLELRGGGHVIALTAIEAKLLQLLLTERGRTLARTVILKKVWGLHEETQTRTLDNFIMRLRQHLSAAGGSGDWIESVRGVGYRFIGDDDGDGSGA